MLFAVVLFGCTASSVRLHSQAIPAKLLHKEKKDEVRYHESAFIPGGREL
jgi:hypothetical protein